MPVPQTSGAVRSGGLRRSHAPIHTPSAKSLKIYSNMGHTDTTKQHTFLQSIGLLMAPCTSKQAKLVSYTHYNVESQQEREINTACSPTSLTNLRS